MTWRATDLHVGYLRHLVTDLPLVFEDDDRVCQVAHVAVTRLLGLLLTHALLTLAQQASCSAHLFCKLQLPRCANDEVLAGLKGVEPPSRLVGHPSLFALPVQRTSWWSSGEGWGTLA